MEPGWDTAPGRQLEERESGDPPAPAGRGAFLAPLHHHGRSSDREVVGIARASGTVDWDVDWDVDWHADGAARSHARRGGLPSRRSKSAFPRGEEGARGCECLV